MDPAAAFAALTAGMMIPITHESEVFTLAEASARQLGAVRISAKRTGNLGLAKKVLRAFDAIDELRKEIQKEGLQVPKPAAVRPPTHVRALDADALAVVPFVTTIPIKETSPPTQRTGRASAWNQDRSAPYSFSAPWDNAMGHLKIPFMILMKTLPWLPVLVAYSALLYFFLALTYVAMHPELWVRAFFWCLDLVPNYLDHVTTSVMDELKTQLAKRIR